MRSLFYSILLLSTGCSTIVNGTSQDINFQVPQNQICYVTQGDTSLGSIAESTTMSVKRSSKQILVDCGNHTKKYIADITIEGWTSITFIDFGIVDYITGAIWEYKEVAE